MEDKTYKTLSRQRVQLASAALARKKEMDQKKEEEKIKLQQEAAKRREEEEKRKQAQVCWVDGLHQNGICMPWYLFQGAH